MEWHYYFLWIVAVVVNVSGGIVLIMINDLNGILWIVLGIILFFIFKMLATE